MAKTKKTAEPKTLTAAEAIRHGWLAYIGAYGLAYERAKPAFKSLTEKYAGLFGDLVEKGAEVEATAKEQLVDVRDRAKGVYGAGFEKFRAFVPARAANDRVKELEAEVADLKSQLGAPAKKTAKRTTKRAKAA